MQQLHLSCWLHVMVDAAVREGYGGGHCNALACRGLKHDEEHAACSNNPVVSGNGAPSNGRELRALIRSSHNAAGSDGGSARGMFMRIFAVFHRAFDAL